jgi:UDP-N-acetylmuramoyl-tripeptide--D-alanyl-D-alanine ligase
MFKNKAKFSYNELNVLFADELKFEKNDSDIFAGVSTDSRTIEANNIFIALRGENFDGNTKAREALEKGASVVIINKNYYESNISAFENSPVIAVDDTLKALGILAKYHRNRFDIPVIMIAGSNGKTTTKEMTSAILSKKYRLLKTEANFNNQIGVPLTLLQMNDSHELAVIEAGTNEPGEIAILSNIVAPSHGLITNIGREHLEQLIDLDGVEMEETFLYGFLKKYGGKAFINLDDRRLKKYRPHLEQNVTYGTDKEADLIADINFDENLCAVIELNDKRIISQNKEKFTVRLQTTGYAPALNAIAAVAIGLEFEVPIDDITAALAEYQPDRSHGYSRMALQKVAGIKILNDCYNANPDSMRMALLTLKEMQTQGEKYAVLGDMRELGESSAAEHLSLLKEVITEYKNSNVFVYGSEMAAAAKQLKSDLIKTFGSHEELAATLKGKIKEGDIVLVKGSRGMEMERIIAYLSD